ncbi:MAG: response regulator transcription factor [Tistlia sp.]|uniref:LuxR C-terminal-related transcriptional regulator n=1 Tax=Tistlia sp. TaxID=3057121 RepID=UPI0034A5A497
MLSDKEGITAVEGATIGVIGNSTLFRAGLASLISNMKLGEIIEAVGLRELANLVRARGGKSPGLILIETATGTSDPVDTVTEARSLFPKTHVVLMSDDIDIENMGGCFAAGLDGYLLKDIGRDSLADSLRLVQVGEKVFPSRLASIMVDYTRQLVEPQVCMDKIRACHLSAREAEILRCLITGDSNKLIARKLAITESTVKVHLKSILKKTRASNRTQAAMWALKRNCTPPVAGARVASPASLGSA